MGNAERTLGQRILEAARMALVMHLAQDGSGAGEGQQEAAGGADAAFSTDGALSDADGRSSRPSSAEREAA